MTAGEEAFGADWRRTLAMRSDEFLSHRSAESLVEHLAVECRYVGLVGINARTEPNLFESIAAAAEPVRRRLILVAPKVSEGLTTRLLSVGDFVTAATSVDEVTVRLDLRTLKSCGAVLPRAPELDASLEQARYVPSSGVETTDQAHGVKFSPIESRLYALFAQRFGEAVSREEILHAVWDRAIQHAKTSNIVDVYVRYLRVKLERAAPHLKIMTVRDVGYGMCEKTSVLASPRLKGWSAQ
jgi:DNA-binding response OmpR family regulator